MIFTAKTSELEDAANELEITAERLHQCMDGIELLVKALSGEWQGNAGKTYAGKIVMLRGEYDKLETLVRGLAGIVRTAAENYEELDSVLAGKINRI